jgi:predicted transcriptional regulator
MPDAQEVNQQRQRTAEIVTAYVKHHKLSGDELVALISTVHKALAGTLVEPEPERMPAVPIRHSVRQEYVVCLDCGWRGKMLSRHILSSHQLTRTEYIVVVVLYRVFLRRRML